MKINSKIYGFVSTIDDDENCIDGLWDFSRNFLLSQTNPVINISDTFFNEIPDGLVIYNNFEVSHMSLWKDAMWDKYMNAINEGGGIYLKRWGDAPIHTIAISFLLTIKQVHAFTDIGYRHDPFVAQRPRGKLIFFLFFLYLNFSIFIYN
jgi:alpha 1,2-mannosyltransferase